MYTCPNCGRDDFKQSYGLSNHINRCKAPRAPREVTTQTGGTCNCSVCAIPTPPGAENRIGEPGYTTARLTKFGTSWWITHVAPDDVEMGPYSNKLEAEADLRGVRKALAKMRNNT